MMKNHADFKPEPIVIVVELEAHGICLFRFASPDAG
jgi:hypothetical protein